MNIEEYLSQFNKVTENPTLEAMEWLMNEFGNPHKKTKFIHVAGTNGKGSICEMLSNILLQSGITVGKFMSPYLIRFNDAILVNGVEIADDEVEEILEELSKKIEIYNNTHKTPVKLFEVTTSLALIYFARKKCDVVVLETGLGGRTDCTNIVDSMISVIANIGYDHMDILGDTIEEITMHKAGIIKPNSDTVMFLQEDITPIIEKESKVKNTKLHIIESKDITNYSYNEEYQRFDYEKYNQIEINLKGKVQIYNAAICIKCVQILKEKGYEILEDDVRKGLKTVVHKARFETLNKEPLTIFDGGHNENAIKNLASTLQQYYPKANKVFIISILKTKDYKTILQNILKEEGTFYFTSGNDKNRYVSKEDLLLEAKQYKDKNIFAEELEETIKKALNGNKDNIVCIIGSFYVYSTVKKIIIITSIIVALLAVAAIVAVVIINNQDKENTKKNLEWGEVYLEVLNDTKKIEEMDDMKIQLCDLDQDGVPELIMYGIKNVSQYIANIYKINDKNKVDTIKVSLDEEFDIQLTYNLKDEKYAWYATTADDTNKKVYDLNIESGKYEAEELDVNYKEDILELDVAENEKVDFDREASKKAKEELFNKMKEDYKTTEDMITEEVKEKVDIALVLRKIEKIDSSKEIVYSVVKEGNYAYPAINIKSADVDKINAEIKEKYGFKKGSAGQLGYLEIEEISYEYALNGKILSLLVKRGGNSSAWANTYNVNIVDGSMIEADKLIEEKGLNKSDITSKALSVAEKDLDKTIAEDKKALGSLWDTMYGSEEQKWKSDLKSQKFDSLYINKDGDICVLASYEHAGGQWSCTKTVIINISKDYKVTNLTTKGSTGTLSAPTVTEPETTSTTTASPKPTTDPDNSNPMTKITYDPNANNKVPEGTYEMARGVLIITNSTGNSFDFEFSVTNGREVPNLGAMTGTAKAIVGGNYAYEEHNTSSFPYDYNVFFYITGNSIRVEDECSRKYFSPYCGNGVTFEDTYTKK